MADLPHLPGEPDRHLLSIAGGGFAGLFAAEFLRRLENDVGSPLSECFDLYAGTSIGGLIALALASGTSAHRVAIRLRRFGPYIFPKRRFSIGRPLLKPKHKSDILTRLLKQQLGSRTLEHVSPVLVVPAIDMNAGETVIFNSGRGPHAKMPVVDVALATSAAPFYLPVHTYDDVAYADGGLVANSPEALAAIEAVYRQAWEPSLTTMLVVGSTTTSAAIPGSLNRTSWGLWRWLSKSRIVKLASSAHVSLANQCAAAILGHGPIIHVDRLLSEDERREVALDNADRKAIETLCTLASVAYTRFVRANPHYVATLRDHAGHLRAKRSRAP